MNPQTLQSSFPNPFPPSWADSWGEDEYGLYADFNLSVVVQFLSDVNHTAKQLLSTMGKDGKDNGKKRSVVPAVIQRFRWIAAGDFLMGSPENEPERFDSREEQHKVTLTNGYWLADTAVTQALWQLVMGGNPARFSDDPLNPVEKVSWDDSQNLINQFNEMFSGKLDGLVIRLPTEAEWEHACRTGTATPFSFGENISSEQVNFDGSQPYNNGGKSEDRNKTVSVKTLPPNAWGLYEMHGNVWEWCADVWQERIGTQPLVDPYHNGNIGARRVMRGGSWIDYGGLARSAFRGHRSPDYRNDGIGLRLSLGYEFKARSAK